MDLIHHYRRQFEYDAWANRTVMEALRTSGNPPPDAVKRLAHIIASQKLWLTRITQQANVTTWPKLSLEECEAALNELPAQWTDYLRSLAPEKLEAKIAYVNTEGLSWTNTVEDILTHVILHSAYHRGQIATDMRAAGLEPVNTDFTHAIRSSLVVA